MQIAVSRTGVEQPIVRRKEEFIRGWMRRLCHQLEGGAVFGVHDVQFALAVELRRREDGAFHLANHQGRRYFHINLYRLACHPGGSVQLAVGTTWRWTAAGPGWRSSVARVYRPGRSPTDAYRGTDRW